MLSVSNGRLPEKLKQCSKKIYVKLFWEPTVVNPETEEIISSFENNIQKEQ